MNSPRSTPALTAPDVVRLAPRKAPPTTTKAAETKGRRPGSGVLCLVLIGLTGGAVGHVAVQARKFEVARSLGKEQKITSALLDERRHLDIEISRLKNRDLLTRTAREKLNMGPPLPTDIRVVTATGVVKSAPPPVIAPPSPGGKP